MRERDSDGIIRAGLKSRLFMNVHAGGLEVVCKSREHEMLDKLKGKMWQHFL